MTMFVQIKAIRKGYKPPRRRRVYLPMHITFSQMAYILEVILELPETDEFEFEFYQEKDRVIETWEEVLFPDSREYSYWDAVHEGCGDHIPGDAPAGGRRDSRLRKLESGH
jgi:hypothetical protein